MKQLLCVLNSDSPNRYGQRFTVRELISALWREHDIGMPLLISHDFLRAIGWQYPFAIHFEPGLTRLSGLGLMVDNKQESKDLSDALLSFVARIAAGWDTEIADLRGLLASHLTGKEKVLCGKESLALIDTGLCTRVFPEVFEHVDKDGLVPLKQLDPIGPGVFRIGKLTIFAHPYFRRSLSRMNTLNSPFLERIQRITDENVSVRIAIDPDVVGLASAYTGYRELESRSRLVHNESSISFAMASLATEVDCPSSAAALGRGCRGSVSFATHHRSWIFSINSYPKTQSKDARVFA